MTAQKWYILGGFGYHGNLLVFFGFWFLVCRVSNFVRRYSELGLETPKFGEYVEAHKHPDVTKTTIHCT